MIRRCLLASGLLLLAFVSSAQDEALLRGRKLFDSHCARCHNMGGTGGEGPSLARPTLPYAADEEALVKVIQEGIEGTDMPGAWQISGNEVRQIAAYVRSLGRVESTPLPGDRERGRDVFEGASGCGSCHIIEGQGGILGPDLSDVGLRRGADYLRESLVSPGATIPERYLLVRAQTRAGEEVVGVRVNEDSFTIQLRDQAGRIHSLSKLELEDLEKAFGESLMPSYGSELRATELDDLIAYLASLRGER
ncbi:MAG TPA: c-type cytochrome [Vicinamibacteria bacterium]|nr:c-type cytochrome [Vicinamibacteria bacterium]